MKLDTIPRISLTALPTPLDNAPRLAKKLGLRKLLIKRDDCTTLAGGGNKARKLEYLMADALQKECDVVLTDGGPQSNHARMTAGAACKVGIGECILFIGGPRFDRFYGNLLLDVVFGAQIRFLEDATVKQMEDAMANEARSLRLRGKKPYVIPMGGSTPLGALGYVQGIRELADQLSCEDKAPLIVMAVGSAGTMAGCILGARLFLPEADVLGISVTGKAETLRQHAAQEANGSADLIEVNEHFEPDELNINDEYYGERYGVPSEAGNKAILMAAQTEGIILDPVYTGKAMSGLIGLAQSGGIDPDRTVVFIHTGGSAGLMAFEDQFRNLAKFQSIDTHKD
ncbi:D-cysteine desulfhydrase family protein [bacterium]|nr:D-cysteine desulfhydrase family protein [bacterium]